MIGVIDIGLGNTGSLINMLDRIGAKASLLGDPRDLSRAKAMILPGVGAFDHGMSRLNSAGFAKPIIRRVLDDGIPLLGICLGMQLLGRSSEEGSMPGLALLPANTIRFDFNGLAAPPRIPHMGWNECRPVSNSALIDDREGTPRYYFVHSYHMVCDSPEFVAGITHYGCNFTAAVQHGNVFGVQFHPEKSHRWGMKLLLRFIQLL
jgi:imidazole glycerol-phosphate synthase subunit HisH